MKGLKTDLIIQELNFFVELKDENKQNQSLAGVPWKRCSEKFRKIHRKTLVPESLFFNNVAGLRPETLLKKRLGLQRY